MGPLLSRGGLQRDFKFKENVDKEIHTLNFYAEVNMLSKTEDGTKWVKVFPFVVPMTIMKFKNETGSFVRISAIKDQEEFGIEIQLPVNRLKKTAECFLQWRDKKYGGAWGLNFISEKDIKKFIKLCMTPSSDESRRQTYSLSNYTSSADYQAITSLSLTSSASSFLAPPNIFVSTDDLTDSGVGLEKKKAPPVMRKPLIPKRSDSRDSGTSLSYTAVGDSVPLEYDPIEYEFLKKGVDENENCDDLDSSVGLNTSARTPSSSSLYVPQANEADRRSEASEDLHDSRPPSAIVYNRHIMTTRKAAWLLVKTILIHSKKGKVDLASHRKWKKYWVALKGIEMLFYHTDEKTVTADDLDEPSHRLDVDCCIVQAVPEYARLENVFSLGTKHGNAYYLQATSQNEVDNWIHCIHTGAAMAMARKQGMENVKIMLKQEIDKLNECMLSDERLKKMAILQLKMEKEEKMKHSINEQILSWESNLEFHHVQIFRLQCYLAAVTSTPNPNPQDLLMHISRPTKHALSKIGIFSVTSFYSLVNARNTAAPSKSEKLKHHKSNSLKARLLNSLRISDDQAVSAIRNRHSPKVKKSRAMSTDNSDNDSNSSSKSSSRTNQFYGRIGDQLYIQLPHQKTIMLPYEINLKISDVIERICMREKLDSLDYFLLLMIDSNNNHGLVDYTIPKQNLLLDQFQYTSIKLCPKLILEVNLTNPADYEHGAFGLELIQTVDERIIVKFVEEGSPARKLGIVVEDEVIEVNGKNLREINNSFSDILEVLNTSSSMFLKLRSSRIDDPKKTQQTTENMISFLVCPPPPKSVQPDLSDDILNSLIVPAPADFDEDGESTLTPTKSYDRNDYVNEVKDEDIDNFLKQTEQLNIMTREMNASVGVKPPVPAKMKPGVKLRKAILELVDTEKTYVKNLKILLDRYLIPLKEEDFLSKDEAELLVNNVRDISDFQTTFFERLKEIIENEEGFGDFAETSKFQNVLYSIGETFLEYVDKFKLYSTFCSCHSRAVKLLELNSNEALKAFLIARNPKQQHTGTLESYLITPIQRILRYPLLMKSMMQLMSPSSDEYKCIHDALMSVEKVADYINEMQRISETYTPMFQDMCDEFIDIEPSDMGVDNLLHYGRVQWINGVEVPGLKNQRVKPEDDVENVTIFIFKKAVVLTSNDLKIRKRMSLISNSLSVKSNVDTNVQVMIPIWNLLLRDHAWSEDESDQVWEIVDTTKEEDSIEEEQTLYVFLNRTGEEKKVFVNAIKEAKKLNKVSNSYPLLGDRRVKKKAVQTLSNESDLSQTGRTASISFLGKDLKKTPLVSRKNKSKQSMSSPILRRIMGK